MCELGFYEERKVLEEGRVAPELVSETLYAWEGALSPHLAAEREGGVVGDSEVVKKVERRLREGLLEGGVERRRLDGFCVVETAGGVASPGPSGTLQCDLYRYLVILLLCFLIISFDSVCLFLLLACCTEHRNKMHDSTFI